MHDLRLHGLVNYAIKRGGSIHPINIPTELTLGDGTMNPSIFIRDGKILMNVRRISYNRFESQPQQLNHQWGPTKYEHPNADTSISSHNIMCELDDDLNIIDYSQVNMKLDTGSPTWKFVGLEDCRLLEWDDRLFLCGVRRDAYDIKGTGRMEMSEIEKIDGEWTEVARFPIPAPTDETIADGPSFCEKNWMPVLDKPWHFVKWTNPTELVRFYPDEKRSETVVADENRRYAFPHDLRGGSQIIRIAENQQLAITHEVKVYVDPFGRAEGTYLHRAIMWDDDWNIINSTDNFSFFNHSKKEHLIGMECGVEFVAGIAFHKGNVLISYGFQDNATFILKMPRELFNEFLLKA